APATAAPGRATTASSASLDTTSGALGVVAEMRRILDSAARTPPDPRGRDAAFPEAVLLVDRPAILDLFAASRALVPATLAVASVAGPPAPLAAWLRQGFREGRHAHVLYVHDAATVVFPFSIEPLATLVQCMAEPGAGPLRFTDLGLPPLGAP